MTLEMEMETEPQRKLKVIIRRYSYLVCGYNKVCKLLEKDHLLAKEKTIIFDLKKKLKI